MAATRALLERGEELGAIGQLIEAAAGQRGGVLSIEGEAGVGKTALLDAAAEIALERGAKILRARGGEHERDFPYGVVRQLLEAELTEAGSREQLFVGAAAKAEPVFEADPALGSGVDSFAAQHGIYWLVSDLAAAAPPLVLLVDDAQWADEPSLRALLYMARRLDELPVALLLTIRSGEPDAPVALTDELRAIDGSVAIDPAPLSAVAATELIASGLGQDPGERFVEACRRAGAGNPFLTVELVRGLRAEGLAPIDENSARVDGFAAEGVTRTIQARLARLGTVEVEVARAIAVLEPNATLERVAALAGVATRVAAEAAARLIEAGLVGDGQELSFVHPLVRNAVYSEMRGPRQALLHAEAAKLLRDAGAEPDSVAAHLLLTPPAGDPDVVDALRRAAAAALARGAPAGAARYLRRAQSEDGDHLEALEIRRETGLALLLADDPDGIEELLAVRRESDDPILRAEVASKLTESFGIRGRHREVGPLLRESIAEVGDSDAELAMRLRSELVKIAYTGGSFGDPAPLLAEMEAVGGETQVERLLLSVGSYLVILGLGPVAAAVSAASTSVGDSRTVIEDSEVGMPGTPALAALILTGDADLALVRLAEMEAVLSRRASRVGAGLTALIGALCHYARGDLAEAEADAQLALELSAGTKTEVMLALSLTMLVKVQAERRGAEEEGAALSAHGLERGGVDGYPGAALRVSRGELLLAKGRLAEAREDFVEAAERVEWLAYPNPEILGWRTGLARVELAEGNGEEALRLGDEALALAREAGGERAIGIALRHRGAIAGGEEGAADLREAADLLERTSAPLQRAHALVDLGAALRRANRRKDAREPLAEGLDLAHRCGAAALEARARVELEATGARPRSAVLTGVESLTPSELRVARLAAGGRTNREIAQGLFVTAKTVETHLRHVYQKLDVERAGLAALVNPGED